MAKKLVIVGTSALAEIAFEYFTHDSDYDVVAFSADRAFIDKPDLLGKPIVAFEDLEKSFSPKDHSVFCAITYPQLNRLRARFVAQAKQKGFPIASYVSSKAFVWRNVTMGENCFIFENNVVQPFVKLGDGVILWSGNHIGHHSTVGDYCFITSHVVVSGFVNVGSYSFLGVNSTIVNNINIGEDNWIGPGVIITKGTEKGVFFKPGRAEPDPKRTAYDVGGYRA